MNERPIRIAHVIYRFDIGGMENGLVNLINELPQKLFSHTIICLTTATSFRNRIERQDVNIIELDKSEGKDLKTYYRFYKAIKRIRPDIVHTRNIGTLDLCWFSMLAGCRIRLHGEHGWDASDPSGTSAKYRRLRLLCDHAITGYTAVSQDIAQWLTDIIGIKESKVRQIYNGINIRKFASGRSSDVGVDGAPGKLIFGTVGRQDAIKALDVLVKALSELLKRRPKLRDAIAVILAGDGPEHERIRSLCQEQSLSDIVSLPGSVEDVASYYRDYAFFVQPSMNEGVSNTVLEAMASGLGVIATRVGGNPELVRDGKEGLLVPANDIEALAAAIENYIDDPDLREKHGAAAQVRVAKLFSMKAMTDSYSAMYRDFSRPVLIEQAM